jgi:cell division protein FtsA
MATKKIYTGIDIGTYHVKVIIAEAPERPDLPMHILGTGLAASRGMRHGYIIDKNEAARSIREALGRAQSTARVRVKKARVAIGGVSLDEIRSSGDLSLTASGGIVTERDVERVKEESRKRASPKLVNRNVLHTIPLEYRLDGTLVLGQPVGLQGTKLSVDTLLITLLSQHYDDTIAAVEAVDVEVEDVMASSLAASLILLTKAQKMAGVVLANIGAETLSIIVFENDTPMSLKTFPIGSSDITKTIALSFQIPMPEAEAVKRGGIVGSEISDRKIQVVIVSRLKDMFTLINAHLKSIGRERLLPAGIIIAGGGAGLVSASDVARAILRIPSQIGQIGGAGRASAIDGTWAVAYGLCHWAYAEDNDLRTSSIVEIFERAKEVTKQALRALLP